MSYLQYADPAAAAIISKTLLNGKTQVESRTISGRPSFSSLRQKSLTRSQRSGSDGTMISIENYEALPTSIKKKYFSASERLHIAQEAAVEKRRKHSLGSASWMSGSTGNDVDVRPSTSQGISLRKRPSQRQPKGGVPGFEGLDIDNISEEQARWFAGLPDKIRKQQFSRKEQISLAVRCKRILQDSSPELADDILRRCLYVGREGDAVSTTSRRRRTSSATVDTDILIDEEFADADALSKKSFENLAPEMEMYNLCSRPSSSGTKDWSVSLPSPTNPTHELSTIPRHPRSRTLSKAVSMTSISSGRVELSGIPPVPPLPPPDQVPLPRHRAFTAASTKSQFTGPNAAASTDALSDTKNYQPSDVRTQLRQYLSPQKFDEAIEFGFAFPNDDRVTSSPTEQTFPHRTPAPGLSDDDGGDDSDYTPETLSPRTPTTTSATALPAIKKPSFDSSVEIRPSLFTALRTGKTRSPDGSIGNRELTIHMTLTRRDLRAPDEDPYSVKRPTTSGVDVERVDPLALDNLPICEDPTGAHGAFAVGSSKGSKGLKRVWRSIRGL